MIKRRSTAPFAFITIAALLLAQFAQPSPLSARRAGFVSPAALTFAASSAPNGASSAASNAGLSASRHGDPLAYSCAGAGPYDDTYSYSPTGSLASLNGSAYAYGDAAHPQAVTAALGNSYGYDAAGNQTGRNIAGAGYTLAYDAENRLKEVKQGAATQALYAYDGDGVRVKETLGHANIVYVGNLYERSLFWDDFQDGASTGWSTWSGAWTVSAGAYRQTSLATSNGNAYTTLQQSGQTVYTWKISFPNTQGSQAAAGIHLFASQGADNRGDSYVVWQDSAAVSLYKILANTNISVLASAAAPNALGQSHSYRCFYDPGSGQFQISRDGASLITYTDASAPLQSGSYYSLRTYYTDAAFDDLAVERVTKYYYAGGERVALRVGTGAVTWLFSDHLGSTSVTAKADGTRAGELWYRPYGATRGTYGLTATQRRYTGQIQDPVGGGEGIYFYNARYYDAALARFTQPDPAIQTGAAAPTPSLALTVSYQEHRFLAAWNDLQRRNTAGISGAQPPVPPLDPQLLNRYTYGRSNPLAYKDESGHFIWMVLGGAVGGLVGLGAYALTHRDDFQWGQAAMWAGAGLVVGATFGAGAELVAGALAANAVAAGPGVVAAIGAAATSPKAMRTIDFLENQLPKVEHILSIKHAWSRVISLSGNLAYDYNALQPLIRAAVETGDRIVRTDFVEYCLALNGEVIVVTGRDLADGVFQITDAWIKTQ